LLVVSAYTPAGTVDNNTAGLDFGTILKFIEEVFNLSNINSVTWAVSRISGRTAISAISSSSANRRMISRVFKPLSSQTSSSIPSVPWIRPTTTKREPQRDP